MAAKFCLSFKFGCLSMKRVTFRLLERHGKLVEKGHRKECSKRVPAVLKNLFLVLYF